MVSLSEADMKSPGYFGQDFGPKNDFLKKAQVSI